MTQTPKISVIIPVYNAEKTIGNSIDSVLSQSFTDFEILIVDDCSTDKSLDIIKSFTDSRIILMRHKKNKGAPAARNTAIKVAKGEYLAFLDSDDIWYKNKLEKHYAYISRTSDPIIQASCTSFAIRRINGNINNRILSTDKDWSEEFLTVCSVGPGSTMIAKKELFFDPEIGLFPESYERLEDWDWLLKYSYKFKLGIVEDVLTEVRVSGYPTYEAVKNSCERLKSEHNTKIENKYGLSKLKFFQASLEIEKALAACHHQNLIPALGHMTIAMEKSPKRVLKLIQRFIQKTLEGDHGVIKNKKITHAL